jgi:glucuronoarabinoxylan endo-1,4-beta-xylanase
MLKKIIFFAFILVISVNTIAQVATIDVAKLKQYIDGFGASTAWHGQITAAEADASFKNDNNNQLGLSILRVRIDPNSSWWNDEKQNALKAKARGAMILASPWTPPASMKTNNNLVGGELKTASYASYATHLKNFCNNLGNVDVISIQNEPNITVGYESCTWSSAQMLDFCKNNAVSIGKPVMVPEAFNFDPAFSDPILNDSAANSNISYIGGHIYGSKAFNYLNAIKKGKKVWMTEHYYNGDGMDTCLIVAKEILDCMYNNMNAYVWWYLRQPGCNLINAGGTLKKKGYAIAQFSKFVRPGYYRVDATYSPRVGVILVAFKGPVQDVVVVINQNTTEKLQSFTFLNDTIPGVTKYVTSVSKNINNEGVIPCTGNSFSDNLEPKSITTYVTNKVYTSVYEAQISDIRIFPNPASDFLQFSSIENVTGLKIFNVIGQPVMSIGNLQSSTLDISFLPPGMYLIKIWQKGTEKNYRFLKK